MSREYEPYGHEWEKEVLKLPKTVMADLLRRAYIERNEMEEKVKLVDRILKKIQPPTGVNE